MTQQPTARATGASTGVTDRAARVRFRRAITLVVMTLFVPGSAQIAVGNKRVGRVALRVHLLVLAALLLVGAVTFFSRGFVLSLGTTPWLLGLVRLALLALAAGWAYLFVDAWRLGEPLSLLRNHRLSLVLFNAVLVVTAAGTLLFGAHVVGVQKDLIQAVAGDGPHRDSVRGRYNVLLAGGDSGADREGLRPDSLTVASIDAETGRTVLIGLPRNMSNFPFRKGSVMDREWPRGWDCGSDCLLNAVSTWAVDHADRFENPETAGMDATVMAVEGITGLEITHWALINMKGMRKLVDAVGGVELNVRDRIPVGLPHEARFRHIEPGVRTLNGSETLWFARARHGSDDYSRMARQKCVMSAMLAQVSPQTVVMNVGAIAEAGSSMLATSIPSGQFDTFVSLAMKARTQKISSVSLVPPLVNTFSPDMDVVRAEVEKAIRKAEKGPKPKKSTTATTGAPATAEPSGASEPGAGTGEQKVTGGSVGSLKDGYAANQSDDVAAVC